MPGSILILSASVGSGHIRAGQAIERAIRELDPNTAVRHVDVLSLSNRLFRRVYGEGYFDVVARAPHLVGHLYDYLDRPMKSWQVPLDRVRSAMQQLNLAELSRLLTGHHWDLVINTHFLPAEVISAMRLAGRINVPQITVVTDFDTHRLWNNEPCEHYFTATEEGRLHLAAQGVDGGRISVVGIPIDPAFAAQKDCLESRRRLNLCTDRPVVLQMSGGMGIGPVRQLHRCILDLPMPIQTVVVTGRNAEARQLLAKTPCPSRHQRLILGFTDAMDDLLAAADVIVSKPGGLTSSESLARETPMLIVDPIPGQETRNADYLLENGAAVKVNNCASLSHKLTALLTNPARLRAMREACRRIARPHAARDVARYALTMLNKRGDDSLHIACDTKIRRTWRRRVQQTV